MYGSLRLIADPQKKSLIYTELDPQPSSLIYTELAPELGKPALPKKPSLIYADLCIEPEEFDSATLRKRNAEVADEADVYEALQLTPNTDIDPKHRKLPLIYTDLGPE